MATRPKSRINWINLLFDQLANKLDFHYGIEAYRVVPLGKRSWKIQAFDNGVRVKNQDELTVLEVFHNNEAWQANVDGRGGEDFLIALGVKIERECVVVEAGVGRHGLTHIARRANLLFNCDDTAIEAAFRYLEAFDNRAPKLAWNWWVIPDGAKTLEISYWQNEQIIGFSVDGQGNSPHTPTRMVKLDLTKPTDLGGILAFERLEDIQQY